MPFVDIQFPTRGKDTSHGYNVQNQGTTPDAQNVRGYEAATDRDRGASRPGLTKYIATQIAAAPIQCLDSIVIARDQRLGSGDVLGQGASNVTARIYGFSAGATAYTSGSLSGSNTLGCYDEDGNAYYAEAHSGHVKVYKVGTDYADKWNTDITVAGSGSPQIFGLTAFDGVVYVFIVGATTGSITSPGIYRLATSDGTNSGLWAISGLVTVTNAQSVALQCLAAGGGVLGVVGSNGTALVLQQINIAGAVVSHSTTLQASLVSHAAKLVTDGGANFYVLTNITAAGVNQLYKITWAGVSDATFNSGSPITSAGTAAKDIAYDPVNFRIGVVGNAVFGGSAFSTYNATTGALVASADQDTFTTWHAIACDDRGYWRLRRSVAAANADLIRVASPGATHDWTLTTSLGVISPRLWLACSGVQVAASQSPMRSSRITRKLAVCNGGLYDFANGVSNITSTFGSPGAPVMWGTTSNLKMIFVDGSSVYPTYDASTNTAGTLTATSGTLPGDSNGNKCTLICTWRGRIVMAGLRSDPHNWFMCATDSDGANWNYAPSPVVASQAVAGDNAPAGLSPDIITALIPYSDDVLIFGCDHSIYQMTGDPNSGGRIDLITDTIGMAWGRPYCKGPDGTLYFFGSRGGVFAMTPGQPPVRISQQIANELASVNVGTNIIRMAWDDAVQGFHLFISPLTSTSTTTHYFWDARNHAWWPVVFGNVSHNALAIHTFDGDNSADRVVLLGGRDGYVRYFGGSDDDGTTITSFVWMPPFVTPDMDEVMLRSMQAELSAGSGSVTFGVYSGNTAELALLASVRETGTWSAGRNELSPTRVAGYAVYPKISATTAWALERIRCDVEDLGKKRRRSV